MHQCGLLMFYRFPAPPADRPYVVLNMVSSVDGRVVVEDTERGLGSPRDQRLNALFALVSANAVSENAARGWFDDADPTVRAWVVRYAGSLKEKATKRVQGRVQEQAGDANPDVAMQVAIALGKFPNFDPMPGWAAILDEHGNPVSTFAGPGEQAGGGVLFAEDQVGVGLAALQGDADGHLADRAAGERVRAGQGLRAQQHVDAEGPALPHQAVQQQRGGLRLALRGEPRVRALSGGAAVPQQTERGAHAGQHRRTHRAVAPAHAPDR